MAADKQFTPPSGKTYIARSSIGGKIEVHGEGAKEPTSISLEMESTVLDSTTTRVIFSPGGHRKTLAWMYRHGSKRVISWPGGSIEIEASEIQAAGGAAAGTLKPLKLTMPGKVLALNVKEGQNVEAGQSLAVVEAMKMENILSAAAPAKIAKIHVKVGDRLDSGSVLISFVPLTEGEK